MSNDYRQYQAVYHNYDTQLSHYGVKGMHWGERRYQNLDGTLTPAGKARYQDSGDGVLSRTNEDWYYENVRRRAEQQVYNDENVKTLGGSAVENAIEERVRRDLENDEFVSKDTALAIKDIESQNISRFSKFLQEADRIITMLRNTTPAYREYLKNEINSRLDSMKDAGWSLNNVKIQISKVAVNSFINFAGLTANKRYR